MLVTEKDCYDKVSNSILLRLYIFSLVLYLPGVFKFRVDLPSGFMGLPSPFLSLLGDHVLWGGFRPVDVVGFRVKMSTAWAPIYNGQPVSLT